MVEDFKSTNDMSDNSPDEHLSKVQLYFDERADYWSDLYNQPNSGNDIVLAARTKFAVEMICDNVPAGAMVLDAGCGGGAACLALLNLGYTVHGIDIAQDLLEHARNRLVSSGIAGDKWQLTHGDLDTANFESESYDGIIALGFIQYQQDEIDALSEFLRILKPGGCLVVTGPSKHRISEWIGSVMNIKNFYQINKPKPESEKLGPSELDRILEISVHNYTPSRFRKLLTASGFEYVNFIGHGGLGRKLTAISRILPIKQWAHDLIVLAKKPK